MRRVIRYEKKYFVVPTAFAALFYFVMSCGPGLKGIAVTTVAFPVPGASGVITVQNLGATSLTLSWQPATDDETSSSFLYYRVCRLRSTELVNGEAVSTSRLEIVGNEIESCHGLTLGIHGLNAYVGEISMSENLFYSVEKLYIGTTAKVQAANNWWGSTSGPKDSDNPSGTLPEIEYDDVTTGRVEYTPWATQTWFGG